MVFLTAWNSVPDIVAALSRKYPDQTITYRWADEDIGQNVGEMVFRDGKCIEQDILEGGSPAAYEMAAEIIGIELHRPTAKKNTKGSRSKENLQR